MVVYNLLIEKAVFKHLRNIPEKEYNRIMIAISNLANDPRPNGYKKLRGRPGYRIREGDYRIIYEIKDKVLMVIVIDVGNRKDIYG
jgi:mRNA interferase RelE/StbE